MSDIRERFFDKVMKLPDAPGCWLWTGSTQNKGYGVFGIKDDDGKWGLITAHRMSWTLAHGTPTAQVLHRCDTPPCVNPEHLFEGTPMDNARDCQAKGRRFFALNSEVVKVCVWLHARGVSLSRLGRAHHVSKQAIRYHTSKAVPE